ncbi:MAG: hypothetical protein IKR34_04625 [Candidatus Gastranaerophilales bacterium]|nr:hypothetical protein [Candidatus Gastranaerophilales bacterium]
MMNIEQIENFAPYIVILLMFIWQNNIFVRPEELEKKHREILENIKEKYVEINAYKEFQNHIYSKLDELTGSIDDLKEILIKKG